MSKIIDIHGKKIVAGITVFLFGMNFIIWSWVFASSLAPDLAVYFFNVGQGDSIFIASKDGTQILIDGGPNSRVLGELAKAMPYYDDSIDLVVLSHPHADHLSGLIDVLKRYKVGKVVESGVIYRTPEHDAFEEIASQKNIQRIDIEHPSIITFGGVTLKILYPNVSFENKTVKNVNETSLVILLEFEGKKILFTGDAGKAKEDKLLAEGVLEDVDVLKVGHQGSKFSSSANFLNKILPEYAVIEVGKNSYGHPTEEALSRLATVGAKIFRTDSDGTVTLEIRNAFVLGRLNCIWVCKNNFFLKRESYSYIKEGTLGILVPHYVYFVGVFYSSSVVAANSQTDKVVLVCVPGRPMNLISFGFEIFNIKFCGCFLFRSRVSHGTDQKGLLNFLFCHIFSKIFIKYSNGLSLVNRGKIF